MGLGASLLAIGILFAERSGLFETVAAAHVLVVLGSALVPWWGAPAIAGAAGVVALWAAWPGAGDTPGAALGDRLLLSSTVIGTAVLACLVGRRREEIVSLRERSVAPPVPSSRRPREVEGVWRVLQQAPCPALACDGQGRVLLLNERLREATGIADDAAFSLAGLWERLAGLSAPDPRDILAGTVTRSELSIQTQEGERRLWSFGFISSEPRADEAWIAALALDGPDRNATDRQLATRNAELETMLYVVSHDLRAPLRAIQSFSAMILEEGVDGTRAPDLLRRIHRASGRLDVLIESILVASRAARMVRPQSWHPARELVEEALQSLELQIAESRAGLCIAEGLPDLYVDRTWAVQALQNLIGNAVKFTVEQRPPEILISAIDDPERGAGLCVADRGPGVPEALRERIFGLFQRGCGTEKDGVGAGLAIVARVAEGHGGYAWVAPRSGGGSEFRLAFGHRRKGEG